MTELSNRARKHLETVILPFWKNLIDRENGGFYGFVGPDLEVDKKAEKGCILNSRIMWFFSYASVVLKDDSLKAYASHAFEFLMDYMYDAINGGLYWSVDYDGEPCDTTKHTYNQAFGIYALSMYKKATGDYRADCYMENLYDLIERRMHTRKGYGEAFNNNFTPVGNEKLSENGVMAERTMNTMLHLIEAYTAYADVSGSEEVKNRLKELILDWEKLIYDNVNGRQLVFFDGNYRSLIDLYSYGHDIECSWLLDEALEFLDDADLNARIRPLTHTMCENVYEYAYSDHSLLNECENGVNDTTRVWWVQAEAVLGFYNGYRQWGDEKYLKASLDILDYIENVVVDKRPGSEWFEFIDNINEPRTERPMVQPWKCPYHNGRMCMMLITWEEKGECDMGYMDTYKFWCESDYFDDAAKAELLSIKDDENEIQERFYKDLEFGTGGLRGIIGMGTNRMNIYTVRKSTQGFANFIKKMGTGDKGVAISCDCRRMSPEFSLETALCFAANGIKAYLFDSLRPTPELSYAVRTLGCTAGVMVTASHNPPEYNGYKAYWADGAQMASPWDEQVIEEVKAVTDWNDVKTMSKEDAIAAGLLEIIGQDIDDKYIAELKKLVLQPEIVREQGKKLKIVYSPFNGCGNIPARRILKEIGFENVYVVPEQELPDGDFTTLKSPNPENKEAFEYALRLAKEVDADLVLATDPDADRLGVYAKDSKTGEYMVFTGNMSGMLICEYVLEQRKAMGLLKDDSFIVKTIVSTNLADKVAEYYNVNLKECLTGFKYIGELIKLAEESGKGTYEFGFEESYGCLVGTHARDKDAIVAVMELCEAAAFYATKGMTLWDKMLEMYGRYGFYLEGMQTITLKGIEGAEKIKAIMNDIRNNPPAGLGEYKVVSFRDYDNDTIKNLETGEVKPTGLRKSNVLYFDLNDDAWVCIRPSGTEPKIKFYIGVKGSDFADSQKKLESLTADLMKLAE